MYRGQKSVEQSVESDSCKIVEVSVGMDKVTTVKMSVDEKKNNFSVNTQKLNNVNCQLKCKR